MNCCSHRYDGKICTLILNGFKIKKKERKILRRKIGYCKNCDNIILSFSYDTLIIY